jgi:hypothetical protein
MSTQKKYQRKRNKKKGANIKYKKYSISEKHTKIQISLYVQKREEA